MKKILIIYTLITCFSLPCFAKGNDLKLQNIYITDTTEVEEELDASDMVLKGYAEYLEDSEAVYLKNDDNEFVLNLKIPQKISSESLIQNNKKKIVNKQPVNFSKYNTEEYRLSNDDLNNAISDKGFSLGALYNNEVDYAQFEQTAGLFTKYDSKWFALSTSYERTIGSTNGIYTDSIYVAPELKLNKYVSLKSILSTNVTYRTKKAEVVLSLNPFANKDNRLNFELGANQTYNEANALMRSQFRFRTKFKL